MVSGTLIALTAVVRDAELPVSQTGNQNISRFKMISEKSKKTIDELGEAELRLEIEKGRASRFQRENYAYLKVRLAEIEAERTEIPAKEQRSSGKLSQGKRSIFRRDWSDAEKWGMGILGTLITALFIAAIISPTTDSKNGGNPTNCMPNLNLGPVTQVGRTVSVNGGVQPNDGCPRIVRIHWSWGDGDQGNSFFEADHTYRLPGSYRVSVTAYDAKGNKAIEAIDVSVP